MKILSKQDFLAHLDFYKKEIINGKVFVFPTDTIYGIGCDARNPDAIKQIKQAKQRDGEKPISFIAPDIDWIKEYYVVQDKYLKHLDNLPGAYTYIFQRRDNCSVSTEINPVRSQADGIRIPNNWFYHDVISKIRTPFCCTSANVSGEIVISNVSQIPDEMKPYVDYVIDGGPSPIGAKGSTIIDLSKQEQVVLRE